MSQTVELSTLDLRYEGYRLRDEAREARLLASIVERGIEEPLAGVDTREARILLDGFKRRRCADKLGMGCVPYVSLGEEEATAILGLMRTSADKSLTILEQSRFIADLLTVHGMSVAEVAQRLSRSKGWVSMRRGLLEEIERVASGGSLPRGLSRLLLHVHAAAVHAHERARQGAGGAVCEGGGRQALERAGHRASGRGLLPWAGALREAIEGGKVGWSLDQLKGCNRVIRAENRRDLRFCVVIGG